MSRAHHRPMVIVLGLLLAACTAGSPTGTDGDGTLSAKRKGTTLTGAKQPAPKATHKGSTDAPFDDTAPGEFFGSVVNASGIMVEGAQVKGYPADGHEAAATATSDSDGHFQLTDPQGRALNWEAVGGPTLKAFKAGVAADAKGVVLQLAPTGTLTGQVQAAGDLTGISIAVPGTPYRTTTDATGAFTIADMPAGVFTLQAAKSGLGRAGADITIRSGETTSATLTLAVKTPSLASITPANGGPGLEVTLAGEHFGATEGAPLSVSFGSIPATALTRLDDATIKVTVPTGAATGNVSVTVDGVASAPKPFTVIKTLATTTSIRDLAPGDTVKVTVTAKDTAGAAVADPSLSWAVTGSGLSIDAAGRASATGAGTGAIVAKSGSVTLSHEVKVHDAPYVLTTIAGQNYTSPYYQGYAPIFEGVGEGMMFYEPWGLALAPDGHLYVADTRGAIARVTVDGIVTTFAGGGDTGRLSGYTDATGKAARFTEPAGIINKPGGGFYVCDKATLRTVSTSGVVTTLAGGTTTGNTNGTGTAARFDRARGLVLASDGNLYVADQNNNAIRRVTPQGAVTTLATVSRPSGITVGSDGNLYVAADSIYKVTLAGVVTEHVPASSLKTEARAVAAGENGVLYVAERYGYVERINANGTVTTLAADGSAEADQTDGTGTEAGLIFLSGILYAGNGTLYVTEADNEYVTQRVRRLRIR